MGHCHFSVRYLAVAGLPPKLHNGLDQIAKARCRPRVAMRQQPAMRVDWQPAIPPEFAVAKRRTCFSFRRKAEILNIYEHGDGETIVNERDIDVATRAFGE